MLYEVMEPEEDGEQRMSYQERQDIYPGGMAVQDHFSPQIMGVQWNSMDYEAFN